MSKELDYDSVDWNEYFVYDETSPSCLRWRISLNRRIKVGSPVGSIVNMGTIARYKVRVNFIDYLPHRVIYKMYNPTEKLNGSGLQIDHIDGNALNNKIENLRLVTRAINQRNVKKKKSNSSGFSGVWFEEKGSRWCASWNCHVTFKQVRKYFPISKYGSEGAKQMAIDIRNSMISELNSQGAGYSDRHGT